MSDWWSDLDDEILRCLKEAGGALPPAEVGRRLGMSEAAACSILVMLAQQGTVRITGVELCDRPLDRRRRGRPAARLA